MEHVICGYGIYGIIVDTLMHLRFSEGFVFKAVPLSSYTLSQLQLLLFGMWMEVLLWNDWLNLFEVLTSSNVALFQASITK